MTLWQRLEPYLFDMEAAGTDFNNRAVARHFRVSGRTATSMIQSYLGAQQSQRVDTLFVLSRVNGRTRAAMWHVGARTTDARNLGRMTVDDVKCRLRRAVQPSLEAMGRANPRAVPAVEATLKGLEAGIDLLVATIGDYADA